MLDVRLVNANVVTMDPDHPTARTLGIWRGRIVGVDDAVAALPAAREVDLQGATVLPGFLDPHVHLAWAGLRASTPSIAPCERTDDVLAVIRDAARDRPAGAWVDVVGYDQRPLGRHLTVDDLDAVGEGRKIFVIHDSGHACVVSSAVLALLPADVRHDRGLLAEGGMAAVRQLRLPYPVDELVDAIEVAGRECLAEGVTAVAEAGIGGGLITHSPIELAAYQRAFELGRLPLRVQVMVAGVALRPVARGPRRRCPARAGSGATHRIRRRLALDRRAQDLHRRRHDGRTAALDQPLHRPGSRGGAVRGRGGDHGRGRRRAPRRLATGDPRDR